MCISLLGVLLSMQVLMTRIMQLLETLFHQDMFHPHLEIQLLVRVKTVA